MNEQTAPATEQNENDGKTVIRPKLENYVRAKSASGKRTHRTDDLTARTLAGKDLNVIKQGANTLGIDHSKWNHLNVGQQRMLIGNAIRKLLNDEKSSVTEQTLKDVYGEPVAPYDAEAEAAAKAERERVAAEKKAQKEAKAAAKNVPAGGNDAGAEAASEKAAADGKDTKTHSSSGKSRAGRK